MRLLLLLGLTAISCGSSASKRFGTVTDDGIAAVHEWCGDTLEMRSHIETPSGKPTYPYATNLLVMYCEHARDDGGLGWVARDSKTNELIGATFDVPPEKFDRLVDRVIVPALDSDGRARLADLRAYIRTPSEHSKVSSEHGLVLIAHAYPGVRNWFIAVSRE